MTVLHDAQCCKHCVHGVAALFGRIRCPRHFLRVCRRGHSPFYVCIGFDAKPKKLRVQHDNV